MLYQLSLCVKPDISKIQTSKFAFLTAFLHLTSPAGIFLSAPYTESLFSFFNFAGFFIYVRSHQERSSGMLTRSDMLLAASGVIFGLACTMRSNGLLSGLIFCYEILNNAMALLQSNDFGANLKQLCVILLAGSLTALGAITPQYLAYKEFCVGTENSEETRPWCSKWVPSIYAWVQEYYW